MAGIIIKPDQDQVTHAPAANTQATIASVTPANNQQVVVTSLVADLGVLATPPAAPIVVVLRDGASGAGTIKLSRQLMAGANGGDHIEMTDLSIPMTPGNQATWESTAAGGLTTTISVGMTYHITQRLG